MLCCHFLPVIPVLYIAAIRKVNFYMTHVEVIRQEGELESICKGLARDQKVRWSSVIESKYLRRIDAKFFNPY